MEVIFAMLLVCFLLIRYIIWDGEKFEKIKEIERQNQNKIDAEIEESTRNQLDISIWNNDHFYIVFNFDLKNRNLIYDWKKIKILEHKPTSFRGVCIDSNKSIFIKNDIIHQSISPKFKKISLESRFNQVFLNSDKFFEVESFRRKTETIKKNLAILKEKQLLYTNTQKIELEKRYLWEQYCTNFPTDYFTLRNGYEFEKFIANLYIHTKIYKAELTPKSADQGVDIILTDLSNNNKIAVQTKYYKSNVGNSSVMQVVAGKAFYKCKQAMVVTNATFTSSAIKLAHANKVILIDGNDVLKMCTDYLPKSYYENKPFSEVDFKLIEHIARDNIRTNLSNFNVNNPFEKEMFEYQKELDNLWKKYVNIFT